MRLHPFFIITGALIAHLAVFMLFSLFTSWYYADGQIQMFAWLIAALMLVGLVLVFAFRVRSSQKLSSKGALFIVGFSWIVASAAGALPFVFGSDFSFTDAFFEAASGFTTTGASVITDIEALPKSILLWRSLMQWLGGMGIIVLSLAVLPLLGIGGMQLYKAEVPGPSPDKLTPRVRDTAILLWKVYTLLTVLGIALLWLFGMSFYDAVNHTFATVSTGGFSTKNASIAAFPSPIIQWTIIMLMFASALNFALHYRLLCGSFKVYAENNECVHYLLWLSGAIILIVAVLIGDKVFLITSFADFEALVRTVAFQVVSISTTTGFVTTDYALWPSTTIFVFIFIMFMGGCAGSTAGGLKVMRITIILQMIRRELFQLVHPNAVRHIKSGGKTVPAAILTAIVGYCFIYVLLIVLGTVFVSLTGLDVETSFTATLTCLSNVGPGFGGVGPVSNFAALPDVAKWVLSLCMLFGRLEIYALILPFLPEFWKP